MSDGVLKVQKGLILAIVMTIFVRCPHCIHCTRTHCIHCIHRIHCMQNRQCIYNVYNVHNVYNAYNVYNVYNVHNVYNIVITLTSIQPFCTLRTPSDIVFNALFNYGYHPKHCLLNNCFFKYARLC